MSRHYFNSFELGITGAKVRELFLLPFFCSDVFLLCSVSLLGLKKRKMRQFLHQKICMHYF